MAKHPFAEEARKVMEENGISFNPDGSTFLKKDEEKTTEPVEKEPAQPIQTEEQTAQDERDRLIEMQRAEIERLKKQHEQKSTQVTKSERELELEKELQDLRSQVDNRKREETLDEFRQILERQGFDSENLDDDVLIEIRDRFFKPVAGKFDALEQRLSQAESKLRDPTPEELRENNRKQVNEKLKLAIPDFDTIFNSTAFQSRLKEQDSRFPFKPTYGHALQEAYENGNTDFIVSEVKAFMSGNTPDIASIADVGATNGVGTSQVETNDDTGFTYSDEEAVNMLRKYQRHDISRQEYSEYRAKLDKKRSSSNN